MSQANKPEPADTFPPDPYPDYPPVYGWLFQAWLVMFLAVICFALLFYLLSSIPKWRGVSRLCAGNGPQHGPPLVTPGGAKIFRASR